MMDLVPFILHDEETIIKKEISNKNLGVIIDGMTRFDEAMVIVIWYVSNSWDAKAEISSCPASHEESYRRGISMSVNSHSLSKLCIGPDCLLAAMKDRASVNGVAMRTVQIVYRNV